MTSRRIPSTSNMLAYSPEDVIEGDVQSRRRDEDNGDEEAAVGLLQKHRCQSDCPQKPELSLAAHADLSHSLLRPLLRGTFAVFVVLLAIWGAIDILVRLQHWRQSPTPVEQPPCWCGDSNEAAIEMGCSYDHIAVDWLPEHCVDHELVAEFDRVGPRPDGTWPYYILDAQLSPEVPFQPINASEIDALAREGKQYWTTREWHVMHCMFTWRKQVRAGFSSRAVEPWNSHEEHVQHCADYIMQSMRKHERLDDIDTLVFGEDRHVGET